MKIIAESAFNHNGDVRYLIELAKKSQEAGADFFTFQIMDLAEFCDIDYAKYSLYRDNVLSFDDFDLFFQETEQLNIKFLPCVLDAPSFRYVRDKGFQLIKLHATDLTNDKLLNDIAACDDVRVILETQCATHFEINYAFGFIGGQVDCLFHGFSNYPTEIEDQQLNSLDYLRDKFGKPIGFADHSLDVANIPLMAMAKGCAYIEKHITLSRNNRNFDYQVSLYPKEFAVFTSTIRHYEAALGTYRKHPVQSELGYRDVMYKKVMSDGSFKRSDRGVTSIESKIGVFDKQKVGVALIARLKSKRLRQKVLLPLHDSSLVGFLYKRLTDASFGSHVYLATSTEESDSPLATFAEANGMKVHRGHAESVIDRMLEVAFDNGLGAIFRVTGDNPLTDPSLMQEMIELYLDNSLDYVRVENVPFGMSAELFSTEYLWRLYLNMENPMTSEYLTWFVLQDKTARKGSIRVNSTIQDAGLFNLSVDYEADYRDVVSVIAKLEDPYAASLEEVLKHTSVLRKVDLNKQIKLPGGVYIDYREYLRLLSGQTIETLKTLDI